ncbi:MAG: helix-turn-helix transcriptional regulator [Faecalibacterium prausnitzii]|nr:helix-turn-helix transcriptional regulator [Faecalibacterium prausnitzii]
MRNVERAKQIAKSKGISFSFVCGQIGKSRGYLAEILAGERDIPEKMLEPVANALGVTVAELKGEEPEQKEKPAPSEESELDARFDALLSQMTDADRADLLEYMEFKVAKRKENHNG